MEIGDILSELKQFVCVGHESCQRGLFDPRLLRLRAEVEIGKNAPLFERLNLSNDGL